MAGKTKQTPKKTKSASASPEDALYEISSGIGQVAQALFDLDMTDVAKHELDEIGDALNKLANAQDSLADTMALRTIAEHGSDEDRAKVLETLKSRLDIWR